MIIHMPEKELEEYVTEREDVQPHNDIREGLDGDEYSVGVWPVPYGDDVSGFESDPAVKDIYVANGGDTKSFMRDEDHDSKQRYLDVESDRDAVLSSDIPDMVRSGEIEGMEALYARDVAMTIFHDPESAEYGKRFSQASDDERDEVVRAQHEYFQQKLEDEARVSRDSVPDGGVVVWDIHDLGSAATDLALEDRFRDGELDHEQVQREYVNMAIDALEDQFGSIEVVVPEDAREDSLSARIQHEGYIVARDPR